MRGPEIVAGGAEERGPEAEPDQVHHQQQQRTRQHALVRLHLFLHQRDGRGQVEVIEESGHGQERQRQRPPGRPDETDEARDGERQRDRG